MEFNSQQTNGFITACEDLGIDPAYEFTEEELKRIYRKKALLLHPDKNPDPDANIQFHKIRDAYDFLMKYENFIDDDETNNENDNDEDTHQDQYINLLLLFLKDLVLKMPVFSIILQKLLLSCETNVLTTLAKLDREHLVKIIEILMNYKDILHLSSPFMEKLEEMLNEMETETDQEPKTHCIILNPLLEDLFENNLYKMTINGFTYVVPLWHNELVYDNSGCEIIVKIKPILQVPLLRKAQPVNPLRGVLEDNIEIDENNNIHVNLYNSFSNIVDTNIMLSLGQRVFSMNVEELRIAREQTIVFAGRGISRINCADPYDISMRGDVLIHLFLE